MTSLVVLSFSGASSEEFSCTKGLLQLIGSNVQHYSPAEFSTLRALDSIRQGGDMLMANVLDGLGLKGSILDGLDNWATVSDAKGVVPHYS